MVALVVLQGGRQGSPEGGWKLSGEALLTGRLAVTAHQLVSPQISHLSSRFKLQMPF